MARGYPDFFGSATFFKFGNLRYELISTLCGAGVQTTILDIAYKGKTYGGKITFHIDSDSDEGLFILTLDGEVVTWSSVGGLKYTSLSDITQQLMRLTRYEYDGTDIEITVSIAPDITFDYQFKLAYLSGSAAGQILSGGVIMAEVA